MLKKALLSIVGFAMFAGMNFAAVPSNTPVPSKQQIVGKTQTLPNPVPEPYLEEGPARKK